MPSSLDPQLEDIANLAPTVLIYESNGRFEKVGDELKFHFEEWNFKKKNGKNIV
jgi:hypothetical protein